MKSNQTNRITQQKNTIEIMVKLYCAKNHSGDNEVCPDCREVLDYALTRVSNCRYGENKPNCGDCKTCCYKKDMKSKITHIMKYSGPRLLVHHPRVALVHILDKFRYRPQENRSSNL